MAKKLPPKKAAKKAARKPAGKATKKSTRTPKAVVKKKSTKKPAVSKKVTKAKNAKQAAPAAKKSARPRKSATKHTSAVAEMPIETAEVVVMAEVPPQEVSPVGVSPAEVSPVDVSFKEEQMVVKSTAKSDLFEAPPTPAAGPAHEVLGEATIQIDGNDIARRAYEIWVDKGYPDNDPNENWLEAERELRIAAIEAQGHDETR